MYNSLLGVSFVCVLRIFGRIKAGSQYDARAIRCFAKRCYTSSHVSGEASSRVVQFTIYARHSTFIVNIGTLTPKLRSDECDGGQERLGV